MSPEMLAIDNWSLVENFHYLLTEAQISDNPPGTIQDQDGIASQMGVYLPTLSIERHHRVELLRIS